ncbi:hypothetical protein RN001_004133 [Aquatica leii]|uniref:Lipase domain-containing protein n=1 Tax=Aquatica leii TaxID=1421715 RepID=A0AAN7PJB5_9COLE|nr:hypothetical protein RN001_004133 [Aquatica leii]
MYSLFGILVFSAFIRFGQTDLCQYNFSVSDLNRSAIVELISFINGYGPGPYKPINEYNVNFWLYTRNSPLGNRLDSYAPVMSLKKTIMLIPGWSCNITNDLMPELKDAYLTRYDANIIIVDWAYYAAKTYGEAFRYIPSIGNVTANFLIKLYRSIGISIDSIHIVGHSMGAQIAGYIGQSLINRYNQTLYRITGLDPAGPIYSTRSFTDRLDESDAVFVDVIHTNAGFLGYSDRCGDVDFYPNCGTFQNGCNFNPNNPSLVNFIIKKIGCDHLRSVDYMIESINHKTFKSKKRLGGNQVFCYGNDSDISYMGEDSILMYNKNSYMLYTYPNKPYGLILGACYWYLDKEIKTEYIQLLKLDEIYKLRRLFTQRTLHAQRLSQDSNQEDSDTSKDGEYKVLSETETWEPEEDNHFKNKSDFKENITERKFVSGYAPDPYKAIDEVNINFWLYTRGSVSKTLLHLYKPVISLKKTILLVHGWSCNFYSDLMPELKDAYLERYDANVIIVDWSYYSAKTYGEAFTFIPSIGEAIAKFLMALNTLGISINSIHLVGLSMGAQISAFTGQSLLNKYSKILKRITGLDPAGPIYTNKPSHERLDESDASFVDIIHTNAGILGYPNRCGDVDFYPNCGTFQNGCNFSFTNATLVDFILSKLACDHLRSVKYMIESINNNKFKSKKSVLLNELFCYGGSSEISYMGEDSILMYKNAKYILFTNPSSPYGKG